MVGQLSNYWWAFLLLPVLGICAGVISGTLGLGSGAIIVPMLVLLPFFAFEQKTAQGTSLAVMVPMVLLGALRYWRNPEVEMSLVVILLIVLGALPGVLAGTELASRLPSSTLRKIFAIFLAIVAIKMFTASPRSEKPDAGETLTNQKQVNSVEYGDTGNEAAEG